jgi:hypothetical protein
VVRKRKRKRKIDREREREREKERERERYHGQARFEECVRLPLWCCDHVCLYLQPAFYMS